MESRQNSKFPLKPPTMIKRQHLRKYSWLPDVLRIKGSIITRIIGPVLTVTIFSGLVAYVWSKGERIALTNSVVPLLSVVVGLILVFRTSYDRYWEGRKCFSTLTSNVRNLSRMIWVHVSLPPTEEQPTHIKGRTPISTLTTTEVKRRKMEVLQCCVAFVYAVKHYLRGEEGAEYDDLNAVLPQRFARYDGLGYNTTRGGASPTSYAATSENTIGESESIPRPSPDATKRIRRKRSKKFLDGRAAKSSTPLLGDSHQTIEFHPYADQMSIPLPLVIAHELSGAIFRFKRDGLLETVGPAGTNAMSALVLSMVDQMSSMERVANTPIPASYGIHLKQCVTLYLFALPLTLINDMGWSMIPIVTVVAFTLMGIEGIADEIEMPFGYDKHDLPLDTYCDDLREEIQYMIERLPEGGHGAFGYDDGEGDD
ncbi:Bestrophin, RFP-TM, chloride channel-domain-containing protein [Pisolithus orientalis]|uniref:Bestrophin, RFP-TM, chloride channel-domain-containing protein n=1 Tax=Pisolithus orientalis TaxID=936130 RepID=UPI00222473DF|nr:Bestrophin, RFP-TM, chloride channel-domain-containing protein [Pisolithus orientalis]KAI6028345.1 Bestrophin, RFP-TM, chloride channel-domain-containing protein [Pisolithus orientalis]